jgi:hypothetical protein
MHSIGGQHGELLGGAAAGQLMGREGEPHPVAHPESTDILAHRVDDSRAVLVGNDLGEGQRLARPSAAPGFPVRGVHPGDDHSYPNFARPGFRQITIDEVQHGRVTGVGVDDCLHVSANTKGRRILP